MAEVRAMTEVAYPDDESRELGARVLETVLALRESPDDTDLRRALQELSARLRRGPVLVTGEVLGLRYLLHAQERSGPLLDTWRALDLDHDEFVAVKVLHGHFGGSAEAVAHFEAGAAAMARLDQESVPRVLAEPAVHEGFHFFVVEYSGSSTLEAAVLAGMDRWRALQAVVDTGRALSLAHGADTLHRAVGPDRVLLTERGAVLTDFDLVAPGQLASAYRAPETMEPDAEPTVVADVYGLGMTAVYALYGRTLPYWVLRDPDRLISGLDVDDMVREALRSATSWDPGLRPTTVDLFLDQLLAPISVLHALAEAALVAGREGVATDHFWELVARTNGDPDVRVGLARALAARRDYDEASNQLMLALRHDALSAIDETLAELRSLSEATGRWEPLVEALERRARDPASPQAALQLELGRILLEQLGQLDRSEEALKQALELHHDRQQAREALESLVQIAETREDWEAFLTQGRALLPFLPPDHRPWLYHRMGRVYLDELGDQQKGLLWLERAHEGGYGGAGLAFTLERIRSARGDWREVIRLMRAQARLAEDEEGAVRTLRRAARIARYAAVDPDVMVAIYQDLGERIPDDPEVASALGRAALEREDDGEALDWLGRLAPPDSEPTEWLNDQVARATLLAHLARNDEAREVLARVLDVEPACLAALRLLGAMELVAGDLDAARERWSAVHRIASGAGLHELEKEVHLNLGLCAWLGEDMPAARQHYHRVVELFPGDIEGWWGVAKVALWALGDDELARSFVRATPLCFTPHEALARLLAGTLDPTGMDAWLALDPLGAAALERLAERSALERATVVVELLDRRREVGAWLFEQLADTVPDAVLQIEAVRWLWCEPPTDDSLFHVAESYRWSDQEGRPDFDPGIHRAVLHAMLPDDADTAQGDLGPDFGTLMVQAQEELSVEAQSVTRLSATPAMAPERSKRAVIQLERAVEGILDVPFNTDEISLGGEGADVVLRDAEGGRCVLLRAGNFAYLTRGIDTEVDGIPEREKRLYGGEAIVVGGARFVFHILEPDEELPQPRIQGAADDDDLTLGLPEPFEDDPTSDTAFDEVPIAYTPPLSIDIDTKTPVAVPPLSSKPRTGRRSLPLLVMLDGDDAGQTIHVRRRHFTIGRGRGNDLVVANDAKVSRRHATLTQAEGVCRLRDNKSANGTYVNGRRIREHILQVGDRLLIGDRMFQFRLGRGEGDELELDMDTDEAEDTDALDLGEDTLVMTLTMTEGMRKVEVVNSALTRVLELLERAGEGTGVQALQELVDRAPARFGELFTRVTVQADGLPGVDLIENLERIPGEEQRTLLNEALLDLVERALVRGCANLTDEDATELLHEVAGTSFRKQLTT